MTAMGERTQVALSMGTIAGSEHDGIRRFLGVPYAAAPFGENRFRAPQPVAPWSGIRSAQAFGATAPQLPYPGSLGALLGSARIPGDDILTVNVWAPADAEQAPIVVWIHGGAFERGTAALSGYDGTSFARDGIVFISVNYRLGSEGFSVLDGAPLNLGLRDVAAAVHWVSREAAAFGGDPARLTLMGESAGGSLVAALLARDDTRALVSGAIIQSAPLEAHSPGKAGKVTRALARRLKTPATREGFAGRTPEELLDARRRQSAGSTPLRGAPGFQLALDSDSLPRSPHEVLAHLATPILIGTNTDEYRLWLTPPELARVSEVQVLLARLALRIRQRAISAYRAAWPAATAGELFGQIATDLLLRAPASRLAQRRAAPTYFYEFIWESPVRDLRAAHAVELAFVFDGLRTGSWHSLVGDEAPQHLATEIHDAWVRFIHERTPGWVPYSHGRAVRLLGMRSVTIPQRRAYAMDLLPER